MNRLIYEVGDVVSLKKGHPCGENLWKIRRTGVDVKLECCGCGRSIWMTRMEFEKRVRKIKEGDKMVSIVHHGHDEA
ncbi:MAG: DUF951 domain-containing protein [Peptoniphilus sp.]|nr:DUF951 domain-containing protein [Peptoniphilus sp.]MDD7362610.1 DUF951 domain-containing protein [Bacillota bacterium]MDY6044991.1 DUF951 domain-containing protein [Peptoniphilus sp.]